MIDPHLVSTLFYIQCLIHNKKYQSKLEKEKLANKQVKQMVEIKLPEGKLMVLWDKGM